MNCLSCNSQKLPCFCLSLKCFNSLVLLFKTDTETPTRTRVLAFILAKASGVNGLSFL